jgi:hypothetical protein
MDFISPALPSVVEIEHSLKHPGPETRLTEYLIYQHRLSPTLTGHLSDVGKLIFSLLWRVWGSEHVALVLIT